MAYIGKTYGFCQRHFTVTESHYCPNLAILKTEDLVRSPVTLDLIREDVKQFQSPSPMRPENDIFDSVVRDAFKAFQVEKVHPIHLNDLPQLTSDTDNSSPGLPWRDRGYATKRSVLDDRDAFQSVRKFWHRIKEGECMKAPDCSAFVRAHLVKSGETKVRTVWGYPATISFQEACFAKPLIEEYKRQGPIAYGYETAKGGCRKILNEFCHYKYFLSSDYKSFDKTIPAWLIRIAFDILTFNIDFTEYCEYGVPVSRKLYQAWLFCIDYFINTPIRLCNGERYRKRKGVASGSYFTQMIDSIVNWIVTTYALRSMGLTVDKIMVMGDDALAAVSGHVDLKLFAEFAQECGMYVNIEKTQFSECLNDIKFLGYKINGGSPLKDPKELWAALRFPERPDRCFDDFVSRAYGLMFANFGNDIEFDNCCRHYVEKPFTIRLTPNMIRFLKILGIDALPLEPPTRFQLQLLRY
uniref:RNA-dependent RNA polymerase n=1 Tax=Vandelay partiti-like virus TaxID=2716665 RepID=A0A6G7PSA6_9VIRU|nr:RNA-dependent RNA polymerase [Vandelay partiti-like virus]